MTNLMNNLEMDLLTLYEMINEEESKIYLKKILELHFKSIPEEPMLVDRSPSFESIIPSSPILNTSNEKKKFSVCLTIGNDQKG